MKTRILIAAAALATLAACTMTQVSGPSQEISFQVAGHSAMTRANTDYKDGYSGVPFGAFAWFKGDDPAELDVFLADADSLAAVYQEAAEQNDALGLLVVICL